MLYIFGNKEVKETFTHHVRSHAVKSPLCQGSLCCQEHQRFQTVFFFLVHCSFKEQILSHGADLWMCTFFLFQSTLTHHIETQTTLKA